MRRLLSYLRHVQRHLLVPAWQVAHACVVVVEIWLCWSIVLAAWNPPPEPSHHSRNPLDSTWWLKPRHKVKNATTDLRSPAVNDTEPTICSNLTTAGMLVQWIGPFSCCLCLVEAVRRVRDMKTQAYENAALQVFEKQLTKFCRYSFRGDQEWLQARLEEELAKNKIWIWLPIGFTLAFWACLVPWEFWIPKSCPAHDGTLLSLWFSSLARHLNESLSYSYEHLYSLAWNRALHQAIRRPRKFYHQFRKVLRWIRFVRFAGPLLRMADKVQAQLRELAATWRQTQVAQASRLERLQRKSLLRQDLRRIASTERVQAALRSAKSQLFRLVPDNYQGLLQQRVGDKLEPEKRLRTVRQQKVSWLEESVDRSTTNLADVYDQLVDLSEPLRMSFRGPLTTLTSTTSASSSHHHKNLIAPNTRFSVGWRVVVSISLIVELLRLSVSWRFAGDYTVSLTEIVQRWLCPPKTKAAPSGRLARVGRWIPVLSRFHKQHHHDTTETCLELTSTSVLTLYFGRAIKHFIDIVCFLDIFVWFFTGELDDRGVVVPKPFVSRCIVPGTLVQVFDHPTLPTKIPSLLMQAFWTAESVGLARVMRWGLVLLPAVQMLVVDPLQSILLSPMSGDDMGGHMSYSGSFVY